MWERVRHRCDGGVASGAPPATTALRGLDQRLAELDGIRGLAVAVVVAFHAGAGWAAGGYLGVSVFFTLSGFLLTALVLDDVAAHGRFAGGRFLRRRARRLVAPAAVVVAAVALLLVAGLAGPVTGRTAGDVLAALVPVANWRFAADQAYDTLFSAPSPLLHLWSLAVEWQLYAALALVATGLDRLVRALRRPRWFRPALGAVAVGALVLSAWVAAGRSFDLRYYGTDSRAAEFLAGAVLAVAAHRRELPAARAVAASSVVAVAGLAWLVVALDLSALQARPWWLLVTAGASVLVVAVAAAAAGPLAAALRMRWLVAVGARAYPLYLVHWPVFVVVGQFGLAPAVRMPLQLALSAVLAEALHRGVERAPVAARAWRRPAWPATGAVLVAVVVLAVAPARPVEPSLSEQRDELRAVSVSGGAAVAPDRSATPQGHRSGGALSPGEQAAGPATADAGGVAAAAPAPAAAADATAAAPGSAGVADAALRSAVGPGAAPAGPRRIAVVGDSQGVRLALGLREWGAARGGIEVAFFGDLGCGLVPGGQVRYQRRVVAMPKPGCAPWYPGFAQELAAFGPDVVAVVTGPFDLADRRLAGSGRWAGPDDAAVGAHVDAGLAEARRLLAGPWQVVWLLPPGYDPPAGQGLDDPAFALPRLVALHHAIRRAAERDPVVDLDRFFASCPGGLADRAVRPDGVHVAEAAAGAVARWLGPVLLGEAVPDGEADCTRVVAPDR